MLKGIFGSRGTERQGEGRADVTILEKEQKAFEGAMADAVGKGGRSLPVKIDGREYIVEDDGASRSVKPI